MLPFLFSVILQYRMIDFPSTHLFVGNSINPAAIDKHMFIVLIFFSGLGFYFLSLIISKNIILITTKVNIVYSRHFFTCMLALPAFVLILENLK